jgi:hypothetical protein
LLLLLLLFAGVFALLPVAVSAVAADGSPKRQPAGPPALPEQARPVVPKPFAERHVRLLRRYSGENVADSFGWLGEAIGDLNRDGVGEYLVTAPFFQSSNSLEGRAYVYDGASGALLATHTGNPGELLGYSAAAAGDVNGDRVADYALGAPGYVPLGTAGRVIVYSGIDHTVLREWAGAPAQRFGTAVAGGRDVNGDGYADIAVGAELDRAAGQTIFEATGRLSLYSGQDGSRLWSRAGFEAGDWLGSGAGMVDDLNGDGQPDVVAAARRANGLNGEAYVFSGADGAVVHTFTPSEPGGFATYGQFFARGAGDTSGDGVEDIFIGDYSAFGGEGRAYVYSGADGSEWLVIRPQNGFDGIGPGRGTPDVNHDGHDDLVIAGWISSAAVPFGGQVNVYSGADGSILQTATGIVENDNLGVDALPLGDLNGDGKPEYMLTAVGLDFMGLDVGHVYVVTFERPAR